MAVRGSSVLMVGCRTHAAAGHFYVKEPEKINGKNLQLYFHIMTIYMYFWESVLCLRYMKRY